MISRLRILYAGTPEFSAYHLDSLFANKYNIVGVLTKPDSLSGRGKNLIFSAVKTVAQKYNAKILQPHSLAQYIQKVRDIKPDIIVVVAYGLMFPQSILDIPPLGCINVHPSLLPRWRGAAPIQRAICHGDKFSGISIIKMNHKLDAGNVLYQRTCRIDPEETSLSLSKKLMQLGSKALLSTLYKIARGCHITQKIQEENLVTYAEKINKLEGLIDWNLSALQIERNIRAFNPWPTAYTKINNNLIKIWKARVIPEQRSEKAGTIITASKKGIQVVTCKYILNIISLQTANKKIMTVGNFLNARNSWFYSGSF